MNLPLPQKNEWEFFEAPKSIKQPLVIWYNNGGGHLLNNTLNLCLMKNISNNQNNYEMNILFIIKCFINN